jgi:hypothetical protein
MKSNLREDKSMETIDVCNRFADKRLGKRGALILEWMVRKMRVVMQNCDSWSEQMAFYRFLNNEKVSEAELIECAIEQCNAQIPDIEEVLLIQDTTDLNLEKHSGRIVNKNGLGVIGNDNNNLGFLCHPTIVVNPADKSLLGLADIHLWSREQKPKKGKNRPFRTKGKAETARGGIKSQERNKQRIEEKESYRWTARAVAAALNLRRAKKATVIQDREGGIYESCCLLRERGIDFVIRVNYPRLLENNEEAKNLNKAIEGFSPAFEYETELEGDKTNRGTRTAQLDVSYGEITMPCPPKLVGKENHPSELTLSVVHVKEKDESVPQGEKAIEWKLHTTHIVNDTESALRIINYYKCRRMIEDLFRTVKTEGMKYEESELGSGEALRKLLVLALMAAVQILKLRQKRGGSTSGELLNV